MMTPTKIVQFANGHMCAPTGRDDYYYQCLRCGSHSSAHWYSSQCLPGLTVHVHDTGQGGPRGVWLARGHDVQPFVQHHATYSACTICYNPDTDPVLKPVAVPEPGQAIPAVLALPGDAVPYAKTWATVIRVIDWAPGTHYEYTGGIPFGFWARQVVTTAGSRWFSHAPGKHYEGTEPTGADPEQVRFDRGIYDADTARLLVL
jgi:hypothetical protein